MASVLDLVKHYQHAIEKYPNDEQKVLKCIDKLFNLGVTVQHLQETGVGRTVNALRKDPGDVGQAARALVYKWKLMVAAEESDQEGDQDTSNYNGNGRDIDDSQTRIKYEQSAPQNTNQKNHEHTNGNHSGSKRNYHSSEEDEPNRKKSKHSNSNESDKHRRSYAQVKSEESGNETEDQDSDNSETEESESEMSDSSVEETKVNRKIKTEPVDKDRSSKHSSHENHEAYKKESSSSKKSHESSKNSSSHHSSQSKHSSDKHVSQEKSHSSDKSSIKSKSHSSHEKPTDKEKSAEKKHKSENKSSEKEKSHKDESSSSEKHHSSSQKHKSSSQKAGSGSEKHKNHSEKHKSDKHNSHSSKEDKEKHKSSSETEISTEKPKSKSSSSSSKEKRSSSKDKESKNKSKEGSSKDSHKSEKKNSSSSNSKSKSSDKKPEKSDQRSEKKDKHKSDTSSSHKSSKSSSSKSKNKTNEETPKKKSTSADGEESDDGIDCGSGASFAEALGMVSPAKPKKKPAALKNTASPNTNLNDLSPAALLSPSAKLAPLPAIEISALPEISPNYKPRPPPKLLPHFTEEEAISAGISSKNQRTKVYSGNKVWGKVPTLFEMCVQVLQEHIDALEYTGGVPYEILKPVVDKATPQQLFMLEHFNPYLMEDTDHLWQMFCNKHFRNKHRQELETWRDMYMRCQEEQEHRLKSLTENIKIAQEAKRAPIKQTKMAYVDSVVKPPRNIARKQALHGTAHSASASPAARVASLAAAPNVLKGSVRPSPSAPVSSSTFNKPKKAPLMQKALQFMRGRKR